MLTKWFRRKLKGERKLIRINLIDVIGVDKGRV